MKINELPGVPRYKISIRAKDVIDDLHLPVTTVAGANTNSGNTYLAGNESCQRRRNSLEDDSESTGRIECLRILNQS